MYNLIFSYFLLINTIHLFCYSSKELSVHNNKEYLRSIFNNMNLFSGKFFSFLEEDNQKASDWIPDKVGELLRREVGPFIINKTKNVSESCKNILYKYLIYDLNNNTQNIISDYHLKKFFEGASKHKNDLSSYDICMYNDFRKKNESNKNEFAESIYLIVTIDKSNVKKPSNPSEYLYTKKDAEIESVFYVRGFCFPQEKMNNKDSCSESDYFNFLKEVNEELNDVMLLNEGDKTYFIIKKEILTSGETFLRILPFLLILIQIILVILRQFIKYLYKKSFSKIEREKNINLICEQDEDEIYLKNKNGLNETDVSNKNKIETKVFIYPKWLKIFSKSFNLSENFKELFNFSLNSTEINNDSGLSYIRGLKSFSFFFLIFGLTFFTFINSFAKTYSKFLMNEFLSSFFFLLFFIGLRYSPRIIFSCSGYTLSFKYVSYIQKNPSFFGVIKFILYQIHKYIIVLLFFLFFRYSLYIISNTDNIERPMWKYFEKNILSKPPGGMFLISFIDLTFIYTRDNEKRIDQTLIDYFWLPFNEMFFFIVGIIIISIGHKYKLRIDYFILISILIVFIVKLLFSYIKKTMEEESYYATLYYYIFDYGKFMLHPIFNLPYYLIGMYFGLINYSIQKGITSLKISNSSQEKAMINLQNMFTGENTTPENKEDENTEKEQLREEIIDLPFLQSGVRIIEWLQRHGFRIIGVIITLLLLFLLSCHEIFYTILIKNPYNSLYKSLKNIDDSKEDVDNIAIDKEYQKMEDLLLLSDYITNAFVNIIYRIDIELFVFFIHSLLFILYFNGRNFINDFFCHIFWGILNRPYFSLILVINPLILNIFYQSETRIILNIFNLFLYSIISGCITFLTGIFIYLFFELPYKRLIRNIFYSGDSENTTDTDDDNETDKDKDE